MSYFGNYLTVAVKAAAVETYKGIVTSLDEKTTPIRKRASEAATSAIAHLTEALTAVREFFESIPAKLEEAAQKYRKKAHKAYAKVFAKKPEYTVIHAKAFAEDTFYM